MNIQELDSSLFHWQRWRGGSISDLGIPCREACITTGIGKRTLQEKCVGYAHGGSLPCRPKPGEIAIMIFHEGEHFWFHIRKKEFEIVFGGMIDD